MAFLQSPDFFLRVAGVSGALAVALGAYGAHGMKGQTAEAKHTFDTGNRYHILHSLALLAVPLVRKPTLVGSLLLTGMVLFCGPCYFSSLTGNKVLNRLAPIGGMTLMAAWASIAW